MTRFLATYRDRQGREQQLSVAAADLQTAKRLLRQRGVLALSLKAEAERVDKVQRGLRLQLEQAPGVKEKAVLCLGSRSR